MNQTLTQKIIARAGGRESVDVGELVWTKVDTLMTHDPCSPGVIGIFKREFGEDARIWDPDNYVLIPDHFVYTADPLANENIRLMRDFAREQGVKYFYDVYSPDSKGVCHIALAEGGHARPGEVLVGTDSHTVSSGAFGCLSIGVGNTDAAYILGTGEVLLKVPPTIQIVFTGELPEHVQAKDLILKVIGDLTVEGAIYCALEFLGPVIDNMSVEERMTVCNMSVECGAKNGIMVPNEQTLSFVDEKTGGKYEVLTPDKNANYTHVMEYDVSGFSPQVAKPHSPDNVASVEELGEVSLDQAYIGSCTGGKTEDFIAAARILKGRTVSIDTYAVPATREVLRDILSRKIDGQTVYEIFDAAGVKVCFEPSCAACCGGPIDTFGRVNAPKKVISTTNRNFPGRMGHKEAGIYLASPYTFAASAVTGRITNPGEFL